MDTEQHTENSTDQHEPTVTSTVSDEPREEPNQSMESKVIITSETEPARQESLISETCQEKCEQDGFEFSVVVEPSKSEAPNQEREITISREETTVEERDTVSPEHTIVTVSELKKDLPDSEEEAKEANVSVVNSDNPDSIHKLDEEQNEPEHTELKFLDEPVPAQHSPASQSRIRAEPESTLVLKLESASNETISPESSQDQKQEIEQVSTADSKPDVLEKSRSLSPEKPTSIASEDRVRGRKRPLFNFKIKPFKKGKLRAAKSEDQNHIQPSESNSQNFKANVRNIFGTLRRTVVDRRTKSRSNTGHSTPRKRPPRPPPLSAYSTYGYQRPASVNEIDQQSLQSVSGPSLQPSPELSKRNRIHQALPDFKAAMPNDSIEVEVNGPSGSVPREHTILSQVAANVAQPRQVVIEDGSIHEEQIRPVMLQRSPPMSRPSSPPVPRPIYGGASGLPPKPPRPRSPPALSPLDYQPYSDSPEHSHLITQRMAMMNMMEPGTRSVYSEYATTERSRNTGRLQVNVVPTQSRMLQSSTSVDYTHYNEYSDGSPPIMQRKSTLPRDYASLVRERVRSLRAEPVAAENANMVSATGTLKPRPRKENYVCSETIKLPKIPLKLKRRQTVPPKTIHARGVDGQPRQQPRIMSEYHQTGSDIQSGDYVMVSQVGVVQSAAPRGVHMSYQNGGQSLPMRQLTSLRSLGANSSIRQQTYLMDSSKKGLLQLASNVSAIQSTQGGRPVSLPYISDSIQIPSDTENTETLLVDVLNKSQPLFAEWLKCPSESADEFAARLKDKMSEYLNICVKLRSVDLQGQFSPFHYPLPSFDVRLWRKCATLKDWANLVVLNEPEWNTDYIYLDPANAMPNNLIYPERPIDTMLTNWLDCRTTAPNSVDIPTGSNNWAFSTPVFHPVVLGTDLGSILRLKPHTDDARNELFCNCVKLAVMLSYADCLNLFTKFNVQASKDLNQVLLLMSTSNCLVVFRTVQPSDLKSPLQNGDQKADTNGLPEPQNKDEEDAENTDESKQKTEETENETKENNNESPEETKQGTSSNETLVSVLNPGKLEIREAIDDTIDRIYQLLSNYSSETSSIPDLLQSVAPPDWVAMMLGRIVVCK